MAGISHIRHGVENRFGALPERRLAELGSANARPLSHQHCAKRRPLNRRAGSLGRRIRKVRLEKIQSQRLGEKRTSMYGIPVMKGNIDVQALRPQRFDGGPSITRSIT